MDENHRLAIAAIFPAYIHIAQLQTIRQRNEVPLR
jgi:hypothetical protein